MKWGIVTCWSSWAHWPASKAWRWHHPSLELIFYLWQTGCWFFLCSYTDTSVLTVYHIPNPCWWEITALILYSELRQVIAMSSGQWPIQTLLGWVASSIHFSSFSSIHCRKWNNSFSQVPPKGTFGSYLIPKEHKHTVEITEEREESFYHRCFFKILI